MLINLAVIKMNFSKGVVVCGVKSNLWWQNLFTVVPNTPCVPSIDNETRIIGRIRLFVSTASRTYELSE